MVVTNTFMKGIILAGGSGTRLYPTTLVVSKQLLPVGDKPMIFYPLATLLQAGIREILLISTPHDISLYEKLLGDGENLGIKIHYKVQPKPEGLAQAYILAEDFLAGESSCLILGDNVFYGETIEKLVQEATQLKEGGIIFGYRVSDPERYGVVEFDNQGRVLSIEEKPENPKSNYAIPGLYFYDGRAPDFAKNAKRSDRGEYEITELHNAYLNDGSLKVKLMGQGVAWLDTGTYESWHDASSFIMTIQKRQANQVACLEEIAYLKGYISKEQVLSRGKAISKTEYGKYLIELASK